MWRTVPRPDGHHRPTGIAVASAVPGPTAASPSPASFADRGRPAAGPVWVTGALDGRAALVLLDHLDGVVERSAGIIVLDLSRVSYVDVAGVLLLLDVRDALAGYRRELVVRAASPVVLSVLAYVGRTEAFRIVAGPGRRAVVGRRRSRRTHP